jgi:hypothetical protein
LSESTYILCYCYGLIKQLQRTIFQQILTEFGWCERLLQTTVLTLKFLQVKQATTTRWKRLRLPTIYTGVRVCLVLPPLTSAGTYAVLGTWCPMWHSVLSALYYSAWPVVVVLGRAWCFTQCSVLLPLTSAGYVRCAWYLVSNVALGAQCSVLQCLASGGGACSCLVLHSVLRAPPPDQCWYVRCAWYLVSNVALGAQCSVLQCLASGGGAWSCLVLC